jgi:hypothetical protein
MELGMHMGSVQSGTRTMAMVHGAMFDAVNAGLKRYAPYRREYATAPGSSLDLAAAAAAHRILAKAYPDHVVELDALLAEQVALVADTEAVDSGLALGRQAADDILAWRAQDGAAQAAGVPFTGGSEPGEWRMTGAAAMMPGWGDVTPWLLSSALACRNPGPPVLSSQEYADAYAEVVSVGGGSSSVRTAEQTEVAMFWKDHLPAHLHAIARQMAAEQQLDLLDGARLFALLSLTLADASICSWDNKYHYAFWRPITAIAEGEHDGNPQTVGDGAWASLLPAPAFPEYPSGHSTMAGAGLALLGRVHGGDAFTFSRPAMNPMMAPRSFTSLWAMAEEIGLSRVHGGIHFSFSNQDGLEGGRELADFAFDHVLRAGD